MTAPPTRTTSAAAPLQSQHERGRRGRGLLVAEWIEPCRCRWTPPAPSDPLSPGATAFEKEKEKLAQQKAEKAALSPYKSPPPEKKAEM